MRTCGCRLFILELMFWQFHKMLGEELLEGHAADEVVPLTANEITLPTADEVAPPAANAAVDLAAAEVQRTECNRQLKAAILIEEPEPDDSPRSRGKAETPLPVVDDYGMSAIEEVAVVAEATPPLTPPPAPPPLTPRPPRPEAPAALQKGLGSGRLAQRLAMGRQETETAADQRDQKAQRLERLIGEQTAKLEALKERAALVGADRPEWSHPKEAVAEARRRRDARRAQQQQQRAALALVSEERRRTSKHIDRLVSAAAATQEREPTELAEPTEPAAADLPDAPDDLDREIRAMRRREQRLRAATPRLEEARFGLEKVRNERHDVGRQIRETQAEMKDLDVQLAAKATQLREMADLARPSADALRHETGTRRLQRAVTELAARRVASEREIARHGQRLERVRCVMSSFLKAQQLPRARPLPEDGTLPAKLAQHVVSLAASVAQLAARKALREATAQARQI